MTLHLAQMNIARMRAPIEAPIMAGFVARLAEINALAEASDGFVWESVEALRRCAYTRAPGAAPRA